MGISTLKFIKVCKNKEYAKKKIKQLQIVIREKVPEAGGLDPGLSSKWNKWKWNYYDIVRWTETKDKGKFHSGREDKNPYSTPKELECSNKMIEFGVSERMRLFAKPVNGFVHSFYVDEEYSRMFPGKKDSVCLYWWY